jgi:hypothetical protein
MGTTGVMCRSREYTPTATRAQTSHTSAGPRPSLTSTAAKMAWRDGRAASTAESERVAAATVVVGGGNRGGEGRTAVERA